MHAASEDAGRYTCIVSNSAGEERKNFELNVLGNNTIHDTGLDWYDDLMYNSCIVFCRPQYHPELSMREQWRMWRWRRIRTSSWLVRSPVCDADLKLIYIYNMTSVFDVLSAFNLQRLGNPVPEITWLKDGQPLAGDARLQVMSNGRFLQISGSQVADTGRYSCLASNSAGDRSRHFNLNVLGMSSKH